MSTTRSPRAAVKVLSAVAVAVVLLAVPGSAAGACGGLLQPPCKPKPPPPAPDPGGSESPDQPVPAPGKRFGFNSSLFMRGWATAGQELDHAAAAGATVHRIDLPWRAVQRTRATPLPGPDDPAAPGSTVADVDTFYAAALARGITPILITLSAPPWATKYRSCPLLDLVCQYTARTSHRLVPDGPSLDEYRAFVRAVKARWPRALIEPWNTPNLFWAHPSYQGSASFAASPEHFAKIQCAAYQASKEVNDDPVLAAGWAGHRYVEYVRRVYAVGGQDCWDLANLHVYPGSKLQFGANSSLARTLDAARDLRARYGDDDPLWITETGFTTSGPSRVSPSAQADGSRRLYNRLVTMPDVQAVLFHTLRDLPTFPVSHHEFGFGFLRLDWSPKPVYCHFTRQAGNQHSGC